jgi:hypothetical protein
VVTLMKHRDPLTKPDDEQLHVLPMYTLDDTDEFGDRQNQLNKCKTGAIEVLSKFECEVRVRSAPLLPTKRTPKKRGVEEEFEFLSFRKYELEKELKRLRRSNGGVDSHLQSSQVR